MNFDLNKSPIALALVKKLKQHKKTIINHTCNKTVMQPKLLIDSVQNSPDNISTVMFKFVSIVPPMKRQSVGNQRNLTHNPMRDNRAGPFP